MFAELVDLSRWAESMVAMDERRLRELVAAKQKAWAASENEPQEPTGAEEAGKEFLKEQKHLTVARTKARKHKENKAPLPSSGREGKIKRC